MKKASRERDASGQKEIGFELAGEHHFVDPLPEADGGKIPKPPRGSKRNPPKEDGCKTEGRSGDLDLLSVFPESVNVAEP